MVRWILLVILLAVSGHAAAARAADALLTGQALQEALDRNLQARWQNAELRDLLSRIEEARGVSILLDRRIDPTQSTSAEARSETVREFIERLAAERAAGAAMVGNTLYVGPRRAADAVRTLAALRARELQELPGVPPQRRQELERAVDFSWADLDEPAGLVQRVSERYGLDAEGAALVPHDLWARAALPEATAAEVLTLVLVQFDLTFAWREGGRGIQIAPIEWPVGIERSHAPPRGQRPEAALQRWRERFPGLTGRVERGRVVLLATIETHEQIDDDVHGRSQARRPARGGKAAGKDVYSLRIRDKPLSALLAELARPEHGAWKFEYDPAALQAAGAGLDQRVTFEVRNASIEQLLRAAFDPLGLEFERDDRTIRIRAQPGRKEPNGT